MNANLVITVVLLIIASLSCERVSRIITSRIRSASARRRREYRQEQFAQVDWVGLFEGYRCALEVYQSAVDPVIRRIAADSALEYRLDLAEACARCDVHIINLDTAPITDFPGWVKIQKRWM